MEEQRTKRVPKCGFCQNHGIKKPLRAHKRDCEFLECSCKLCINTRLKREHMADMQYIKRNGIVELERFSNEQDAQAKKKDIYVKIFQERMANKNKKRMMKDLKSGNCQPTDALLLGDTSSSAVSPNSSISDPLAPSQLATLANLRTFTNVGGSLCNLNTSSLDAHTLANLNPETASSAPASRTSYTDLFPNTQNSTASNLISAANENSASSAMTSDQFLKAAKLLGIGLNTTPGSSLPLASITGASQSAPNSIERGAFSLRNNEDVDLAEITEFADRLSILSTLNSDEKVLNAAICIIFNSSLPLTLLNPSNVAEEIYSTYKQLSSATYR